MVNLSLSNFNDLSNIKVLDLCCGDGRFLNEVMNYGVSESNLYGVDIDGEIINNLQENSKINFSQADSLNKTEFPFKFDFDLIVTNPPFNKKIKNDYVKDYQYNKIDLCFVERCMELLKENGLLCIVLSESLFHSPSNKKIRENLFYKYNIMGIVDLPHNTFRPYNNAKCNIILIKKTSYQNHTVELIKLEDIGHDHNGKPTYNDDINLYFKTPSDYTIFESYNIIRENDILVPRYYFNKKNNTDENNILLGDLINKGIIETFKGHGSPQSKYKGMGDVPYIRVKDVVNDELYINPLDKIPKSIADSFKKINLLKTDIVMVTRGSYRIGDVAQIHSKDLNSIYTRELQFFRVIDENNKYHLNNYNLFMILKSDIVKEQYKYLIFNDTTLPTLHNRYEHIQIPIYSNDKMETISKVGEKLFNLKEKYWQVIHNYGGT